MMVVGLSHRRFVNDSASTYMYVCQRHHTLADAQLEFSSILVLPAQHLANQIAQSIHVTKALV